VNIEAANSTEFSRAAELFDVLNGLKWFEFHVEFSKQIVESEVYTFEEVDRETEKLEL
jgi:hypothetical protein